MNSDEILKISDDIIVGIVVNCEQGKDDNQNAIHKKKLQIPKISVNFPITLSSKEKLHLLF